MSLPAKWLSADSAKSIDALIVLAVALGLWWLWRRFHRRGRPAETPFADFPTRQIKIGDWTYRYHQSGVGPHLVLLHGIGANLFCWRFLAPLLREKFTVTAVDLPGFGGSSKLETAGYGLDEQSERLGQFFDRMGMSPLYLVGNSMGGNIALWFALLNPKRVRGLALIAPASSPWLVPLSLQRWLWLSGPVSKVITRAAMKWAHGRTVSKRELVGRERIEETFRTYGGSRAAVRSFMAATEAIRDPRLAKRAREISTPTLILWGSRDKLVSRKVIDELEAALDKAESLVHVGGGHHLQEDEPEWVATHLASFFRA